MAKTLVTSFGNFMERNCAVSITLDKRSNRKGISEYPLSVRFTINRQRLFVHVGGNYSEEEFSEICNTRRVNTEKMKEKKTWEDMLSDYGNKLRETNRGKDLTLDMVRLVITGKADETQGSFLTVWEEYIEQKNAIGKFTTAESYGCALKSFKTIIGTERIKGFMIGKSIIEEWNEGMKNGVQRDVVIKKATMRKPAVTAKKLVGKIADATRGIYLRSFRKIWKVCEKRGLIVGCEYPFSNKADSDLISIPKGDTRKDEYINVEKMTELYNVFIEKRYPDTWSKDFTENVNHSLGLFLAQYLCNGFNLADAAELVYDNYYFGSGKKALRFNRKKTADRTQNRSEVTIPITDELQTILDEIASPAKKGTLVFPDILKGANTPKEIRKRVSQENQNVRKRMAVLCEALGWEERVSGTWARHSFATNLHNAGVDMQYISESMGHAGNHTVTSLYISTYPLEKQFEFNKLLLNIPKAKSERELLLDQLSALSVEDMKVLLSKVQK